MRHQRELISMKKLESPFQWLSTAFLFCLALTLSGCNGLQTRSDSGKAAPHGHSHGEESPSARATPVPVESTTAETTSSAPAAPTPAPAVTPTFLNKELPKVGLILGPGGLKTFAHIGVLRELSKARIPLQAVVGLEWGALMGALYAQREQVNDVEWKAMKLREQDLPSQGGFLLSRSQNPSMAALQSFLDTAFAGARFEGDKGIFACPAYWSKADRFGWMTSGSVNEAMRACLPYPPLFSDNSGVLAAPFSISEAADYLRSRGANLIILVNVLGQNEFVPSKMLAERLSDNVLWSEIRRSLTAAKAPSVQVTINIDTSGHPLNDFAGRRALMELGAKGSADAVAKIAGQYGF